MKKFLRAFTFVVALAVMATLTPLAHADWGEWCAHGGHGGNEPVIIILDAWGNCIEFCGDPPDCEGVVNKAKWVPTQSRPFNPFPKGQPQGQPKPADQRAK